MLIIGPENADMYKNELLSAHKLRKSVFIDKLNWPTNNGTYVIDDMEFDDFDIPEAYYIINTDDKGNVNACARLMPTDGPNLLCDKFGSFIQTQPIPRDPEIWEISRFCSNHETAPKNIVGQLIAAMLEFAQYNQFKNYVSLSDIRIEPLLRRAGWNPTRLGEPQNTGTDYSTGEIFDVSAEALSRVREKSKIDTSLLTNLDEITPIASTSVHPEQEKIYATG